MKILGIDLGTNSLGWAILENKKFIDSGVIIFEQGIPDVKGKESDKSPAAERRTFRAARRLKYRRRLRKYHTLKILIENKMCPLTLAELQKWIREGHFPIENKTFITWLGSTKEENPYYFRAQAATTKLPPYDLGRVFYHLAQRRGFRSSRKNQDIKSEDADDSATATNFKQSISNLTEILKKKNCTLGQFFFDLFQKGEKIRRDYRCGRKEHYEVEFKKICDVQQLPDSFVAAMTKAIFLQRPLRSQKHLVGKCSLEKKYPRCMAGHPLFEKYRMLSFINTIKKDGIFLSAEERQQIQREFFVKTPFEFKKLAKKLSAKNRLSEFNYINETSITPCSVTHQIQKALDTDDLFSWTHFYTTAQGQIREMNYQTVFDALTFFDDNDRLKDFAITKIGLSPDKAEEFIKIKIPAGYANFSLHVIKKILPFLEKGLLVSQATFMANLPKVMGEEKFQNNADKIIAEISGIEQEYRADCRNPENSNKVYSLNERLQDYLETQYQITPDKFAQIYQYNNRSDYKDCTASGILPPVNLGMIYNPVVYRSLTTLRRLVNHLRKNGKIDECTEIHIELTRSVNNKNTRIAVSHYQKAKEKQREEYKQRLNELGIEPTEDCIRRYALWQEQKEYCLYTGKKITLADFLNNVHLEHTVPRSRGGDSSMENLTLCFSDYNQYEKSDKLPSECPNYSQGTAKYEKSILDNLKYAGWEEKHAQLQRTYERSRKSPVLRAKALEIKMELDYWRNKISTFSKKAEDLNGFAKRQLVDTGVMARHAVFLLKSAYPNTYSRSGKITSWARKAWGIQGFYEEKNRTDHVHHAIDAMCIAALTNSNYQQIAAAFKGEDSCKVQTNHKAYPWSNFANDVYEKAEGILVRHLTRRNERKQAKKSVHLVTPLKQQDGTLRRVVIAAGDSVRGQLHQETYFGKIQVPGGDEVKSVIRKPLTSEIFSSEPALDNIVDETVKKSIIEQIENRMKNGISFKDAVDAGDFHMKTKSGQYNGPLINKVRCFVRIENPLPIKKHVYESEKEHKKYIYANTAKGGNFMAQLYRTANGKIKYKVQPLWNWAKTHKQQGDFPENNFENGVLLGIIYPGTMALIYEETPEELKKLSPRKLSQRLYKIIELRQDGRVRLLYNRKARNAERIQESARVLFDAPADILRITSGEITEHLIFEGIDFEMTISGEIHFMK